jgi:small subunit ribosomal protein S1
MNDPMDQEMDRESQEPQDGEDFAALLESYSADLGDDLRVGDRVTGRIIAIGEETVFVDTGTKVDGAADRAEFLDPEGALTVSVGDTVSLYVVALDESEIRLSRAIAGVGGLNMLQEALDSQIPVEGKVRETCKGGFVVEVLQRRAFCPASQMDLFPGQEAEAYVGQTLQFLMVRLEKGGRNIVLSRRRLLEKEQQKAREAFMATVEVGSICQGEVVRTTAFGAFVQLAPGVDGLVHVSEMSWSRVEDPAAFVQTGQPVSVQILSMEPDKKPGQVRISLSMKQVDGDPWQKVPQTFKTGDQVTGKVTRCARFGAFVEIAPGVEGLVHISEMSHIRRVMDPTEIVSPGDAVTVSIKAVEPDKRRISLSIRDVEGDPWADIETRFKPGQRTTGRLEKKERFGWFIQLAPGITGLMPKSRLMTAAAGPRLESLRPGDPLEVLVEEIHAQERKLTLAPADEAVEASGWQSPPPADEGRMGSLGEKLRQAMETRKPR